MKESTIKTNTTDDEVHLSKNKLFLLVREIRELRQLMKESNLCNAEIIKSHDYKVLETTFNKILDTDGIDNLLTYIKDKKLELELVKKIQEEN